MIENNSSHTKKEEYIVIFVCINAIGQLIADIILEILKIMPVVRINHISLTFLNAFLSLKTMSAIYKDQFRFLHEDSQTLFILEFLLIIGDIFYVIYDDFDINFIYIRCSFIVLSIFNLIFITYIIIKYKLYHLTYQGNTVTNNKSMAKIYII